MLKIDLWKRILIWGVVLIGLCIAYLAGLMIVNPGALEVPGHTTSSLS